MTNRHCWERRGTAIEVVGLLPPLSNIAEYRITRLRDDWGECNHRMHYLRCLSVKEIMSIYKTHRSDIHGEIVSRSRI